MKNTKIKIGFLISYDYKYFFNALKTVYKDVDEIYLSIDKNFKTWSGQTINIEDSFFYEVEKIDTEKKVKYHRDNFYFPEKAPMECETYQRNEMSKLMGDDCWKLQIDVDEYFLDFSSVKEFLKKNQYFLYKPNFNPINIRGKWITLFKEVEGGFLYIDNQESFSFCTNLKERYDYARNIEVNQLQTNFLVIHQSWARNEDEIKQKISNWGHKNDFDVNAFFEFWKSLNKNNYKDFIDFHPVYPKEWNKLEFLSCDSIEQFIELYKQNNPEKNSRNNKVKSKYYLRYLKSFIK